LENIKLIDDLSINYARLHNSNPNKATVSSARINGIGTFEIPRELDLTVISLNGENG
tara:strand:- start:815 stop:985 length:171 start_codon:yes stop_codon:yes gene_type:complete